MGPVNPSFVWTVSPLGAAIEVVRDSPEHEACESETHFISLYSAYEDSATAMGIVAEFAFFNEDVQTFLEFVERHNEALEHILNLVPAQLEGDPPDTPPLMQAAQYLARTIATNRAALEALQMIE